MRLREMVRWRTEEGERIVVGDVSVTPVSRSFQFHCPYGGLVHNKPLAILVERDGTSRRTRIPDRLRQSMSTIMLITALTAMAVRLLRWERS